MNLLSVLRFSRLNVYAAKRYRSSESYGIVSAHSIHHSQTEKEKRHSRMTRLCRYFRDYEIPKLHPLQRVAVFSFAWGLEGRAAQSNSPVDCCDRERPSARRRASRAPLSPPCKSTSSEVLFSMKRTLRCMKNEARLRLMKRGFAVLMVRALHLTSCWIYGNLFE